MTRVEGGSPERAARRAQAKAEGAKTGDTITWMGETFALEPGPMPGMASMILTHFAAADPSVRDPQAEDGMWEILEMLLAQPTGIPPGEKGFDPEKWRPGEFVRFRRHARRPDVRASLEQIVEAMQQAVEIVAARPTGRPPASSNGRPPTTANSTGDSSAPAGPASSG